MGADEFKWMSSLGVSVSMFMGIGVFWLLIGVLAVPMMDYKMETGGLFVSYRTDLKYFGKPPYEMLQDPAVYKLRTMMITVISGFLVLAGVVFIALSWFGLRQGHPWALAALSLSCVIAVLYWTFALWPYLHEGVNATLADLPPFMWIPAFFVIPATILGIIGLR
jgi:predicted small integral membrane protein